MYKIILEPVDNGFIKTVIDDNINSGNQQKEIKETFNFNKMPEKEKLDFLYDLSLDLGLDLGNINSKLINLKTDFNTRNSNLSDYIKLLKEELKKSEIEYLYEYGKE